MSISSSLNAGVMGLSANASKLAVISDNIANSSTFGYKRSEADFHSMVVAGGTDSYTAGGVRTTSQKMIDERGSLIGTSNPTDIAVRGRGMFPVTSAAAVNGNGNLPFMLQTTGSFRQDEAGYLKSEAGLVLMGWRADADGTIPAQPRDTANGLEPVQILTNQRTAEPTTDISLGVNLPATSTSDPDNAGPTETLSLEYFDSLGRSQELTVNFSPVLSTATPPTTVANRWNLQISDNAGGSTTDVANLTLPFYASGPNAGTLNYTSVGVNSTPVLPVWDGATGILRFNVDDGTEIRVDLGTPGAADGMTQFSDSFAPIGITKNGAPPGSIVGVDIDENGKVNALFDTGITRTLYQVPLADVPNPNGLIAADNQTYLPSSESGAFFLWDAGTGPTGELVNNAREESTTDVARELTDLIQTQRAYSSNAKVIQTVDEMLQETTNIKR